jgi:hypothetical protein
VSGEIHNKLWSFRLEEMYEISVSYNIVNILLLLTSHDNVVNSGINNFSKQEINSVIKSSMPPLHKRFNEITSPMLSLIKITSPPMLSLIKITSPPITDYHHN